LERGYRDTVRPFLKTYCLGCHGGAKPKGDLDLSAYPNADAVTKDLAHWSTVLEQLEAGTRPPKAKPQPPAEARRQVVAWCRAASPSRRARSSPTPTAPSYASGASSTYTGDSRPTTPTAYRRPGASGTAPPSGTRTAPWPTSPPRTACARSTSRASERSSR